jgi:Ca2+-binding RTX toxin-like protein
MMDSFYTISNVEIDDTVKGTKGADTLTGLEGNTKVTGLSGDDDLYGVDPTYYGAGNGEIDILSGGSGADYFYIGDEYEAYYQGDDSNADILDFDPAEGDLIAAYGTADDYTWSEVEEGLVVEYLGDPIALLNNVDSLYTSDFIFL